MDIDDLKFKAYLEELYRQTGGDCEVQVSMHDLGASIGLDKAEAGGLAEQLIVQGQAELRTLSGGISITPEGLEILGFSAPSPPGAENDLHLGLGPVADDTDRQTVHLITKQITTEISTNNLEYDLLEEIVLDLKTIEVHLLSPRPKTGVLLELFRSLQGALEKGNMGKIAAQLKTITN